MTPNVLIRAIPDTDLRQLAREALSWQKTGALVDGVLRRLAERLVKEAGLDELVARRPGDKWAQDRLVEVKERLAQARMAAAKANA